MIPYTVSFTFSFHFAALETTFGILNSWVAKHPYYVIMTNSSYTPWSHYEELLNKTWAAYVLIQSEMKARQEPCRGNQSGCLIVSPPTLIGNT